MGRKEMAEQTVRRYQSLDDLFAIGDTARRAGRLQRAGQHYEDASNMAIYLGDYGEARRAARLSSDSYEKAHPKAKISDRILIYLALNAPEYYSDPEISAEANMDMVRMKGRRENLQKALRLAALAKILGPVETTDLERIERLSGSIRDTESQIDARKARRIPY